MHPDEVATDAGLVRRLLAAQFSQWADLPVERVASDGTDNAIYRLGSDLAVRLPRIEAVTPQIEKEHRWLPWLAPRLPLAIPVPLARGEPGEGYPFPWSVCRWLDGERPTPTVDAARRLVEFLLALRQVDPTDGPPPGRHNFGRGVPLAERDDLTRAAIDALGSTVDRVAATAAWDAALAAAPYAAAPVWVHGDLSAGNLVSVDGTLTAVLDFGGLAVGDPACDLMIAWSWFSGDAREVFRAALAPDPDTWARGIGWALSVALVQLPYYQHTNPPLAATARLTIERTVTAPGTP